MPIFLCMRPSPLQLSHAMDHGRELVSNALLRYFKTITWISPRHKNHTKQKKVKMGGMSTAWFQVGSSSSPNHKHTYCTTRCYVDLSPNFVMIHVFGRVATCFFVRSICAFTCCGYCILFNIVGTSRYNVLYPQHTYTTYE